MAEIAIGLAGLGTRAIGTWIPLLQTVPGFRIVAVCDPLDSARDRAADLVPGRVRSYRAYDDLLADEGVEAVGLTVRAPDQGAMAAQALDAGKHVHAEVPAAHTLEDCWRIVTAAERSGKVYALAEQTRYWGFVEAWRDLVGSGRLGHPSFAEGQYFHYLPNDKFVDTLTGEYSGPDRVASTAGTGLVRSWQHRMPPIHYLPHELSPLLKILDDRVVRVVGMGTRPQSYAHPQIGQADVQVALMQTANDTVMRLAASFAQPHPEGCWHWYEIVGTGGRVEWKRASRDQPRMWLFGEQMHDPAEVDWRYERTDAPAAAAGSGHGDADFYTHIAFRDAVLGTRAHELDVYGAMDTAAPAILAADSIARGNAPLEVPDFRPGVSGRRPGELPTA